MTVKELKEILEDLVKNSKGHYSVFVGDSIDDPIIIITDFFEEINISDSVEE